MRRRFAGLGLMLVMTQQAAPIAAAEAQTPGGTFVRPTAISTPTPGYPPEALRQHHEGTVTVRLKLGADGAPLEVLVEKSSGYSELDAAAVSSVSTWKYRPATRDGQNVEITSLVPLTFHSNALGGPPPDDAIGPVLRCEKASSPTETAICSDPELVKAERLMESTYHFRLATRPAKAQSLQDEQQTFVSERATHCVADTACIRHETFARIQALP
jgi:TonB family protein